MKDICFSKLYPRLDRFNLHESSANQHKAEASCLSKQVSKPSSESLNKKENVLLQFNRGR